MSRYICDHDEWYPVLEPCPVSDPSEYHAGCVFIELTDDEFGAYKAAEAEFKRWQELLIEREEAARQVSRHSGDAGDQVWEEPLSGGGGTGPY